MSLCDARGLLDGLYGGIHGTANLSALQEADLAVEEGSHGGGGAGGGGQTSHGASEFDADSRLHGARRGHYRRVFARDASAPLQLKLLEEARKG